MKRTSQGLIPVVITSVAVFLLFAFLIAVFEVPNRSGLDSSAVRSSFYPVTQFFTHNNEALVWSGVLLCFLLPILMKVLIHRGHLKWNLSSEVHPVHSGPRMPAVSPEVKASRVAAYLRSRARREKRATEHSVVPRHRAS